MVVEFYTLPNGNKPAKDFLDSLPGKLASKTKVSIDLLRKYGYLLQKPYVEKVDDNIWELRTKQSTNITRIFYFFFNKDKAILTNGFVKKTNKIPKNEIIKAREYREDYIRRHLDEKTKR